MPALVCLVFAIPRNFPHHGQLNRQRRTFKTLMSKEARDKLDILGVILLLFATLSLTAGFEEADSQFSWKSAYVITLLTLSGLLWVCLLLWERHITKHGKIIEPILPWRFITNRAVLSLML